MAVVLQEPSYWILAALAGGRRHGYAILTEVGDLTDGRVRLKVTTLYAALDRMEREGLIADDGDEIVDGRRRRYVVLTQDGAAALASEADRMRHASREALRRLQGSKWAPQAGTN